MTYVATVIFACLWPHRPDHFLHTKPSEETIKTWGPPNRQSVVVVTLSPELHFAACHSSAQCSSNPSPTGSVGMKLVMPSLLIILE